MSFFTNASGVWSLYQFDVKHPTELKLESFRDLSPGWCYGDGVQITENAIATAQRIHEHALLYGFPATDAFPGISGEVRIAVYPAAEHYFEFTIEPNGEITFVAEENDEETGYQEGLSLEQALRKLRELRIKECGSSDSYIPATMTGENPDSKVWHLKIPVVEVYPSLTGSVLKQAAEKSVNMFENITRLLQGNPRFFGNSKSKTYLMNAS